MTATLPPPTVPRTLPLRSTTVGRKAIMAVTGVLLYAFVAVHMIGNLKFFTGAHHFDSYAAWLRTIGQPLLLHGMYLWIQRGVLLLALLLHIWAAWSLTRVSHAARPIKYASHTPVQATVAARTMRWGGVALALFIVFHILQFTTGTLGPHYVKEAVYANVVNAFKLWYVTLVYIAAMAALAMHLYHGVWSMTQTLGINRPSLNRGLYRFSQASAAVIFLGFISVPVAVLMGVRP